jgi:creatinine amidohydrolase
MALSRKQPDLAHPLKMELWDGKELRFDRLTSPEIGDALSRGFRSVVFACGATEQHGPHIALSMDAVHGTGLALAVARKLGRTLVAPTIPVGCSEHHMSFPGTLSLRKTTFQATVADYVYSLARHGFERILIIPTHGGNYGPIQELLPRLRDVAGRHVEVRGAVDLNALVEIWTRVAEAEFGLGEGVGGHADVAEGSIMMALHPDRVRPDRVVAGRVGALSEELKEQLFADGMAAVSKNGILGDPHGMNPALGRLLLDAVAEHLADQFGRDD